MAQTVDQKLLKQTKFPPEFSQKVDMQKVNIEVMKKWIASKISEILGNEDDVVIELCFNLLEGSRYPNIKFLQIQLTGFLDKDAATFCNELWTLCLSAQANPQGVPKELLEAKKLELIQEKIQAEKAADAARRRREEERARERDINSIRQRERNEQGRARGGRGYDQNRRPPVTESRSPPPRRRGPPPPRNTDTYIPEQTSRRENRPALPLPPASRRRSSPSRSRSRSRSSTPPATRQKSRRRSHSISSRSSSRNGHRGGSRSPPPPHHRGRGGRRHFNDASPPARARNASVERPSSRSDRLPNRSHRRRQRTRSTSSSSRSLPARPPASSKSGSRSRHGRSNRRGRSRSRSRSNSLSISSSSHSPSRQHRHRSGGRYHREGRSRRSPSSHDDGKAARADIVRKGRDHRLSQSPPPPPPHARRNRSGRRSHSPSHSRSRSPPARSERTERAPKRRRSIERYEPRPKRRRNSSESGDPENTQASPPAAAAASRREEKQQLPADSSANRFREKLLRERLIAKRNAKIAPIT